MLSRARLVGVRALSSQGSALPASWRTGRRGHADLPQILVAGHREGFIGRRELRVDMHSRLLDAHIPPYSYVVTKPGVLVGSTNKVEKTSTLHGGLLSSIRRKLNGGNMFLDIVRVNGKAAGSAVLAPHDGLATVMPLIPGGGMLLRADAFLACTSGVKISNRAHSGVVDTDTLELHGGGTVAISSYGEGVVVDLGPAEDYIVLQRHLLAWDTSLTMQVVGDPDSAKNRLLPRLRSRMRSVIHSALGREDRIKLTGPGKLCFSVRVKPTLADVRKAVESTIIFRGNVDDTAPNNEAEAQQSRRSPKPPRL